MNIGGKRLSELAFITDGENLKIFPLFNKSDLATRWGVTRQVVNNWESRHEEFPKRFNAFPSTNRQTYYPLYEIEHWENSQKFKELMQLINTECLVSGCKEKRKAKQLCINHYANYIYYKQKGNVDNVEQFINLKKI